MPIRYVINYEGARVRHGSPLKANRRRRGKVIDVAPDVYSMERRGPPSVMHFFCVRRGLTTEIRMVFGRSKGLFPFDVGPRAARRAFDGDYGRWWAPTARGQNKCNNQKNKAVEKVAWTGETKKVATARGKGEGDSL